MNTKQKGNLGIAAAISYFISNCYIVSIPLNDSQAYDLIVEKDGILYKVEIKTSEQLAKNNITPVVTVKSNGGTSGTVYGNVATSGADLLFVHHLIGGNWLIPINLEMPMTTINLGDKYIKYKI